MTAATTMMVLRVIHILSGVVWAGGAVVMAAFLFPSVRAAGPAGGAVVRALTQVRKVPVLLMIAGVLTVLSGVVLYWRDAAGFTGGWERSGMGMTLGVGGALGLAAAIVGMAVSSPTVRRMGALGAAIAAAGAPPAADQVAEMQRLQARLARALTLVAVLLVLATIAMAAARYVG